MDVPRGRGGDALWGVHVVVKAKEDEHCSICEVNHRKNNHRKSKGREDRRKIHREMLK